MNTNQQTSKDFTRQMDRRGITITGAPPSEVWIYNVGDLMQEQAPLWRRMARLPDRFVPWQYWALLLLMTMVAIVGLLT